jgi:hypothetical protein
MGKDIQICAIGNALVDIQIEVPDDIIHQFNLNKGEMQLTDIKKQQELIKGLSQFPMHKSSGGSAANSIIAFSQLGGKAAYQTVIGNDVLGKFYSKEFTDLGIELSAKVMDDNPTGTCLVLITPDSERTMVTALGASAFYNESDVNEDLIKRSQCIYLEGYEFTQEASYNALLKAVDIAKKHETNISLTFSDVFVTQVFYDKLKTVADSANLIFCNESEAIAFSKQNSLEDAIEYFKKYHKNFVITKGANGSIIRWHDEIINIPAYKIEPKDSTGAGDMFAGAFMFGFMDTKSVQKAGHLASYTSSQVVAKLGARLGEGLNEIKEKIFSEIK